MSSHISTEGLVFADTCLIEAFHHAIRSHEWTGAIGIKDMALILAEECGEAVKAVNDYIEGVERGYPPRASRRMLIQFLYEVAQTGAVARRILCEMHERGAYAVRDVSAGGVSGGMDDTASEEAKDVS